MKTSELTGAALDWAVLKCLGADSDWPLTDDERYSANWSQGGPIVEREINKLGKAERFEKRQEWRAWHNTGLGMNGPTPLIAAMRCYVASKLGDEVEVPDELT
jgi:hypothetical protein